MKRIYVMRHGKSDWNATYGADHERPLNNRGIRCAGLMGRFLAATGQAPDLVVSSSAVRALTTAGLAAEAGDWGCEIRVQPDLYGATRERVLAELRALDAAVGSVLIAGHEPTSSDVVGSLIGSAEVRFPTAALACIEYRAARWDAVEFGRGSLLWFVTPKLLQGAGFDAS